MKIYEKATVIKNNNISEGIYDMILMSPNIASEAIAGQFVELYTGRGEYLLPRPISICRIYDDCIRLVYQVVGKGTDIFSKLKAGDEIDVLGPCGNGFDIDNTIKNNVVIGGGIGVPPLLELVKQLDGNAKVFIGAKSKAILSDEFKKLGAEVYISSDDGSEGFKGNVIELIKSVDVKMDRIYSCGPSIMLKHVAELANKNDVDCQISMEERMACGIGVCVGCAIKIKCGNDWEHKKVCKDGPVFSAKEVIWQ